MKGTYRVHTFPLRMTADADKLEQFLNNLEGDLIAIIPNVGVSGWGYTQVDFLLIVERLY